MVIVSSSMAMTDFSSMGVPEPPHTRFTSEALSRFIGIYAPYPTMPTPTVFILISSP